MAFWFKNRITLDSITFGTLDWELQHESKNLRYWSTPNSELIMFRYLHWAPVYPFDFTNLEAARRFFGEESQKGFGAIISVDFDKIDGVNVIIGVFKGRSPNPEDTSLHFGVRLIILYRDFSFEITIDSAETGTTGGREAAVSVILGEKPDEDKELVGVENMEDSFEQMRNSPIIRVAADNEEYDKSFPKHPLSKVRALQRHVLDTLVISDDVKKSKPYVAGCHWLSASVCSN
ncbi:MAG: hypothetical protein COA78_11370 [Blastopirellula sp.]|nr:MAG: hypothetical protein COA78_11370 [Blastopirellula sp.]